MTLKRVYASAAIHLRYTHTPSQCANKNMSLLIKTEPVTAGALAQKPNICCICSNRDRLSFYAEILIIFWTYRGELLRLYEKFRFSRRQNRKKYCQTVLRSNIYNFENTTFIVSTPGIQLKVRVIE